MLHYSAPSDCLLFERAINLHLHYIRVMQSPLLKEQLASHYKCKKITDMTLYFSYS